MFKTFLISSLVIILSSQFQSSYGKCCGKKAWIGCCGVGDCNFFCCDCDGGCNYSCEEEAAHDNGRLWSKIAYMTFGRKRRSEGGVSSADALSKFRAIDRNRDGVLDEDEIAEFASGGNNSGEFGARTKRETEFARDRANIRNELQKLDKSGDGLIQPQEFDSSLA